MNHDQVGVTGKVDLNSKVSGKRRLFVKGAAGAVPAVLTLRSGAAFALNSAEMCVTKDNGQAVAANPDVLTPDNTDIWVRTQVGIREVSLSAGTGSPFSIYEDPDSPGLWRHENYVVGSLLPSELRTFSDTILPSPQDMVESGAPGIFYEVLSTSVRYILVIMDPEGAPIDIGQSAPTSNGLPYITGSCWASASPGLV